MRDMQGNGLIEIYWLCWIDFQKNVNPYEFNIQESCTWHCRHLTCTKKCGEICDRKPCYEPCDLTLNCGHECIGYCGEPCPPLCRVCDEDEVTGIIFGHEDEPDAR